MTTPPHRNTLVPQAFTQVAGLTTSRTLRCLAETSILNTETPETTGVPDLCGWLYTNLATSDPFAFLVQQWMSLWHWCDK